MVDVWEEYADKKANERAHDELKKSAFFLLKEGVAPEIVAQAN